MKETCFVGFEVVMYTCLIVEGSLPCLDGTHARLVSRVGIDFRHHLINYAIDHVISRPDAISLEGVDMKDMDGKVSIQSTHNQHKILRRR